MRTRTLLLVLTGAGLIFFACRKETSQEGPSNETLCGYAPYYTGSFFSYTATTTDGDVSSYTVSVLGDSTVDALKYKVLQTDADGSILLARCNNGVYTQTASEVDVDNYDAEQIVTTNLKDNVRAGSSWVDTISVETPLGDARLELKYTITQKDFDKVVLVETFKKVIAVRTDASVVIAGLPIDLGTLGTSFYALNVGLIQIDTESDTTQIYSYNINKP
ncbi:hypothetical protein [uncultured Chitinophaga sp.]|uniref:hypothetical protein n=1 Tax=uncultured Chitinophaga sp. TaxID=339340 RepID=UPI0025E3DAA4|nr:hypothetical protein [uncultured Chitinophaga sp.]